MAIWTVPRTLAGRLARAVARRPRRLPPDRLTLAQAERAIAGRRTEIAYVFDPMGRQLFRQEGTADLIIFQPADVRLLKDAILVHNHPPFQHAQADDPRHQISGFSRLDLELAVRYDLLEIRAVTAGWRYVMTRPDAGWPLDEDLMGRSYVETARTVRAEVARASNDSLLLEEVDAYVADEAVRRMAEWAGFSYRQEQWER